MGKHGGQAPIPSPEIFADWLKAIQDEYLRLSQSHMRLYLALRDMESWVGPGNDVPPSIKDNARTALEKVEGKS